jgi:peptidoglycan/LPS O-acetylase OafA/YrhL
MNLKYYKELDGVRAMAAFMVMIFHFWYAPHLNLPPLLLKMANFGRTGVSLFFVLSGFLITRILIATKESPNYFTSFYVRRSLRIFPLYYLFLILIFIIIPLFSRTPISPFNLQVYNWVYLQNFAETFKWPHVGPVHLWSLAVEEHFYLFWPLLIYFLNVRRIAIASVLIIIMAFIVRYVMIDQGYEVYYFTFARIDELSMGSLLAILEIKKKLSDKNSARFLLLSVIVAIPTLVLWAFFNGSGNSILQVVKYNLLAFTYFGIVAFVISARNSNLVKRFFRTKPMLFSGRISYGLYIYHGVCFVAIHELFPNTSLALRFIIGVVFSFLVATTSYYLVELNFLKLKRFFEYKKEKEPQPETGVVLQ